MKKESYILKFKVFTKSSFKKIEYAENINIFKIYINVIPEKGKANKEIINIISEKLDIPRNNINIISGLTTTIKLVEIFLKKSFSFNEIISLLTLIKS